MSGRSDTVQRLYVGALVGAALVLAVLNGFEETTGFVVDEISVWLLLGMALPAFARFVEEVKAGGLQFKLRGLDVYDQLLAVLPEIGRERRWTFYTTRGDEHDVGDAFLLFFRILHDRNRTKLTHSLRAWLASRDPHLQWLATEVVGYFRMEALREELPPLFRRLDADADWERWQLNALWAWSRFDDYRPLQELLEATRSERNQEWLLFVYPQMIQEAPDPEEAEDFSARIDRFLDRNPALTPRTRRLAEDAKRVLAETVSDPGPRPPVHA